MTNFQIGLLGCAILVLLLFSSMPVAFAMGITGFVGYLCLTSPNTAMSMMAQDFYSRFSDYNLTVIPLFILMGQICFHSGISGRLFNTAYKWIGALPGGMAMATVGACAAFGAICGSGPATTATMTLVAMSEMKKYKYDMELAAGVVAAGGTLGMMIPPSVVFIVYAIMAEQSIGKLFLAGILPGLLTATLFCLSIYVGCIRRPHLGPPGPRTSWGEKTVSLVGVSETVVLFVLVMGGMFFGFFTPTEGAAIGATGSIAIAVVRRRFSWKMLYRSLNETLRTSCMVMIIIAGATMFGHFLAITRLPSELADWLCALPLPSWIIMFFIILFYLVGGCFLDALAMVLLTVPIFFPVIIQLHYDPIWFGVIIVLVTQMGTISPPVGVCSYIVTGIERDIPLQTVFKGVMPFLLMLFLATAILMVFPQIATWLPGMIGNSLP